MKKNFAAIIAGALSAIALSMSAYASENDIVLVVNEKNVVCEQPPVIVNDSTLVPVRAVSENLDCSVEWNGEERSVAVSKNGTSFKLYIDRNYIETMSGNMEIEAAPQIINDTTMVPVRIISELLGCNVDWDGKARAVLVNSSDTKALFGQYMNMIEEFEAYPYSRELSYKYNDNLYYKGFYLKDSDNDGVCELFCWWTSNETDNTLINIYDINRYGYIYVENTMYLNKNSNYTTSSTNYV